MDTKNGSERTTIAATSVDFTLGKGVKTLRFCGGISCFHANGDLREMVK